MNEDLFNLVDKHRPTDHRGCGIVQMLLGNRHAVVAAVCARSIRQHWDGHVTLYHDAQAAPYARQIADAAGFTLVPIDWLTNTLRQQWSRNTGYIAKTFLPRLSSYESTLQMDVDMLVVDRIQKFDLIDPCATQFGDWVTTGRVMRKRIENWSNTHGYAVRKCLEEEKSAINTGVLFYKNYHAQITEVWPKTTLKHAGEFIADEIAMQLMVEMFQIRVIDDAYNRSPRYGGTDKDDTVIWHFHGKKHCKEPGLSIWWPEYQAAVEENYAGVRDWTPAGDKRLREFLNEVSMLGGTCIPWPADWPKYKQTCFASWNDCCDMLTGPCSCGAWHQRGEFEFDGKILTRYGKPVETKGVENVLD